MSDSLVQDAEGVLSGIKIPPRPSVLTDLIEESRLENPNIQKIGQLIAKDVALSVGVLKLVNSPFYGMKRKVETPQQASIILGVNIIKGIVTGLSLKGAYDHVEGMDAFWGRAELVANVCMVIASSLPGVSKESAYTFGLFRDCGIPLLMQRLPAYRKAYELAVEERNRPFTAVELEHIPTTHVIVGTMMAKSWGLADDIIEAITHHHEQNVFNDDYQISANAAAMVAVGRLAEYVIDPSFFPDGYTSEGYALSLGDHLGFDDVDIQEFVDHAMAGGA